MKRIVAKVLSYGAFAYLVAVSAQGASMSDEPLYQTFEFGNFGHGAVTAVQITYGALTLPRGFAHKNFGPVNRVTTAESEVSRVPESVTIRWTSADAQRHEVVAPIRSVVHDRSCLHGFRFAFVDDHVDIYLISRVRDCSKLLDTKETKVFPP
jgi:hypothetical protein